MLLFPTWYNAAFLANKLLPNDSLTDAMRLEKGVYEMRNGKVVTAALFGYCEKGALNRVLLNSYSHNTHFVRFLHAFIFRAF